MFRIIKTNSRKQLQELSLKQREQFFQYQRERYEAEWPSLEVATGVRFKHEEEPGSPSRRLRNKR